MPRSGSTVSHKRGGHENGLPLLDVAASVAIATIVAIVALFAFSVGRLPTNTSLDGGALQAAEIGGTVWPDQLLGDTTNPNASNFEPYLLSVTESIRQDFEAVRIERMAIEESIESDYQNPALRKLWRHAYQTELLLIDEAGRLLDTLERGYGI